MNSDEPKPPWGINESPTRHQLAEDMGVKDKAGWRGKRTPPPKSIKPKPASPGTGAEWCRGRAADAAGDNCDPRFCRKPVEATGFPRLTPAVIGRREAVDVEGLPTLGMGREGCGPDKKYAVARPRGAEPRRGNGCADHLENIV